MQFKQTSLIILPYPVVPLGGSRNEKVKHSRKSCGTVDFLVTARKWPSYQLQHGNDLAIRCSIRFSFVLTFFFFFLGTHASFHAEPPYVTSVFSLFSLFRRVRRLSSTPEWTSQWALWDWRGFHLKLLWGDVGRNSNLSESERFYPLTYCVV